MPKKLFFDTETTGIPDWKLPSESEHQPHLVELAALLIDTDTMIVVDTLRTLIKPDGWTWDENDEAFKAHGIPFEVALEHGMPEPEAISHFLAMVDEADELVGHNAKTYDKRIIRIALKRYGDGAEGWESYSQAHKDALADTFKEKPCYDTMWEGKAHMRVAKTPKLTELHQHCVGRPHEDAHRALPDTVATARCYFVMNPPANPAYAGEFHYTHFHVDELVALAEARELEAAAAEQGFGLVADEDNLGPDFGPTDADIDTKSPQLFGGEPNPHYVAE